MRYRAALATLTGCKADRGRQLRPCDRAASSDFSRWRDSGSEYMAMSQHRITDTEYAAALAAGQPETEMEVRAQARCYRDRDDPECWVPDPPSVDRCAAGGAHRGFGTAGNLAGRIGNRAWRSRYPYQRAWFDHRDPSRDAATARRDCGLRPRGRATSEVKRTSVDGGKSGRTRKTSRTVAG